LNRTAGPNRRCAEQIDRDNEKSAHGKSSGGAKTETFTANTRAGARHLDQVARSAREREALLARALLGSGDETEPSGGRRGPLTPEESRGTGVRTEQKIQKQNAARSRGKRKVCARSWLREREAERERRPRKGKSFGCVPAHDRGNREKSLGPAGALRYWRKSEKMK
jgi:hypothetical protein